LIRILELTKITIYFVVIDEMLLHFRPVFRLITIARSALEVLICNNTYKIGGKRNLLEKWLTFV